MTCPNANNHIGKVKSTQKGLDKVVCPWCNKHYVPRAVDEWTPNSVVRDREKVLV